MIESSIINWIDLGDSMQLLDIYDKKKLAKVFDFVRVLLNHNSVSNMIHIILNPFIKDLSFS